MTFSYLFRSHLPCSRQSVDGFGFVFLPAIFRVHGDLCPNEVSRVTPVIEQDTLFERLTSGCNYDDVMLTTGIKKRFGPVQLERLQLQRIQSHEKLRCPLKTESPFSRSDIDEQVLNAGQPHHAPLSAQFYSGHICSVDDSPSVVRTDGWGECRDSPPQGSVISGPRNEQFCMSTSPLPGWRNREYQQRHHREHTNPQRERTMEKHFETYT